MPFHGPKLLTAHTVRPPKRGALSISITVGVVGWLSGLMMPTADAFPDGFFPILGVFSEGMPAGTNFAMDARGANGNFDGFVQLNPFRGKDSQLWKKRSPVTGTNDVFKFENKAFPGQCLAWEPESFDLLIKPCSLNTTKWRVRVPSFNKVILERTDERDFKGAGCAAVFNERALLASCDFDGTVWDVEPLGVVQTGVGTNPPSPPKAPTGCTLFGTAVCGLLEVTCDPFSPADSISFSGTGGLGVGVISKEPRLGLINGSYLNEGRGRVAVCASKAGMTSCGTPMDVSFGPLLCPGPRPGHHCPAGQIPCGSGCGLPSDPECRLQ